MSLQRVIERSTALGEMLKTEILPGYLYEDEQQAHKFVITCVRNDEIEPMSGAVTAEFVAVDQNVTYNLIGGLESGKPYVILSPDCYQHTGKFSLAIFVGNNTGTTCVYACSSVVVNTVLGDEYDSSGLMPDVTTVLNTLNAAIAQIPPNYGASFAPPYTDLTFPVSLGQYCTNNGAYYRCTTAIPASEDFTAAHWTQTSVSAELNRIRPAVSGTTLVFGS